MAVENYLHKVITPGIPEFEENHLERLKFWAKVCSDKLKATYPYFKKPELKHNYDVLVVLEQLLKKVNKDLELVFSQTIYKK